MSHLIPTRIIDRNGRYTTVYRRPDIPSASSSRGVRAIAPQKPVAAPIDLNIDRFAEYEEGFENFISEQLASEQKQEEQIQDKTKHEQISREFDFPEEKNWIVYLLEFLGIENFRRNNDNGSRKNGNSNSYPKPPSIKVIGANEHNNRSQRENGDSEDRPPFDLVMKSYQIQTLLWYDQRSDRFYKVGGQYVRPGRDWKTMEESEQYRMLESATYRTNIAQSSGTANKYAVYKNGGWLDFMSLAPVIDQNKVGVFYR